MKTKEEFKFVGMSKPKTITLETKKQNTFKPSTENITQERFNALFEVMKGNWDVAKVLVEHDGYTNGIPINSKFIEVTNI